MEINIYTEKYCMHVKMGTIMYTNLLNLNQIIFCVSNVLFNVFLSFSKYTVQNIYGLLISVQKPHCLVLE